MSDSTNNHLGKVVVKGFKSIKNFELEIKPINILIGANGSGKSNFISLFTFLRHLSEGKLQNYVQKHGSASAFFILGQRKLMK
ncbi:AAA family ATPase [Pseudoalteromonas sp. B62]|uniref:AAA family ATPase n=1 Tax=Pseudoalteromonas sp. B62 TaxID=630483 RepID=UPI00301B79A2